MAKDSDSLNPLERSKSCSNTFRAPTPTLLSTGSGALRVSGIWCGMWTLRVEHATDSAPTKRFQRTAVVLCYSVSRSARHALCSSCRSATGWGVGVSVTACCSPSAAICRASSLWIPITVMFRTSSGDLAHAAKTAVSTAFDECGESLGTRSSISHARPPIWFRLIR